MFGNGYASRLERRRDMQRLCCYIYFPGNWKVFLLFARIETTGTIMDDRGQKEKEYL
jgi:hypothetical protein